MLDRRPSEELLERALAAWTDTHDPGLEEAILRLGRGLARGGLEVDGEREWHALAAAGGAADVDRLLDTKWHDNLPLVVARVQALARFPPDPRISRKLAAVAPRFPFRYRHNLHAAVAEAIVRAPTPAVRPMLVDVRERLGPLVNDPYPPAIDAIDAIAPRAVDPALLAEVHAAGGDGRDLAALWAAHDAAPDDEQRRAVLADAMQLASDPRGELIQLQLAIAAGRADRKVHLRVARLLELHLDEWCAPFPGIDHRHVRFERGFVVALHAEAPASSLAASLDRPEWQTVEELSISISDWQNLLPELVARLWRLRRLALNQVYFGDPLTKGPFANLLAFGCNSSWLPDRTRFPNLRVAAGCWHGNADLRRIYEAAAALELDAIVHLGVRPMYLRTLAEARRFGPVETRVAFGAPRGFLGDGWILRMRHDGAVADLAWREGTAPPAGDLGELLHLLRGAGIGRLRVYAPRPRPAPEDPIVRATAAARAVPGIAIEPGETFDLGAPG